MAKKIWKRYEQEHKYNNNNSKKNRVAIVGQWRIREDCTIGLDILFLFFLYLYNRERH